MKIYEYKNCSTCQKAIKFLDARKIAYQRLAIVDQPPSISELKRMLQHLQARGDSWQKLFNTSGQQYRELGISEKIKAGLGEEEALKLLSKNGKLIKRPFFLSAKDGAVGFKEDLWKKILAKPLTQ